MQRYLLEILENKNTTTLDIVCDNLKFFLAHNHKNSLLSTDYGINSNYNLAYQIEQIDNRIICIKEEFNNDDNPPGLLFCLREQE